VPSLLVDERNLPPGEGVYAGTMDLDVGFALTILEQGLYTELAERMRRAGWEPDTNDQGNRTYQRWKSEGEGPITVDFLIPPSSESDRAGALRHIESDLAAVVVPGLHLAFRDRERIQLRGKTIRGERATRTVSVCGPGAFVVLKALAFSARGENKDAYDLYYVVRNYGTGVVEVARRLADIAGDPETARAIDALRQDFLEHDGLGPRRVASFVGLEPDEAVQADVVGFVGELLRTVDEMVGS